MRDIGRGKVGYKTELVERLRRVSSSEESEDSKQEPDSGSVPGHELGGGVGDTLGGGLRPEHVWETGSDRSELKKKRKKENWIFTLMNWIVV